MMSTPRKTRRESRATMSPRRRSSHMSAIPTPQKTPSRGRTPTVFKETPKPTALKSNDTGTEEGITVAVRMRPLNQNESSHNQIWKVLPKYNSVSQTTKEGRPLKERVTGRNFFSFDKTFDGSVSTEMVYDSVAKDIVSSVVSGLNGTIFAYGQTSSGKTFTMQGSGSIKDGSLGSGGIVHMAANDIFGNIKQAQDRIFLVRASFLEIYNEEVRDLLSTNSPTLQIREDPRRGVFVQAKEEIVTDFSSLLNVLFQGENNRQFASTAMNERSSRSHTIFRITIESRKKGIDSPDHESDEESEKENQIPEDDGAVLISTLNLVDLAGSESVRHTGATGDRQKEGGMINTSLLTLSRVIVALGTPNQTHINFRDSKLTRILQPSLCGNARMAVICCATPSELYLEETRSTLLFASRAKLVKTRAQVNEVLDDRSIIRRLQRELAEAKKLGSGTAQNNEQLKALAQKADAADNAAKEANKKLTRLQMSILNSDVLFGSKLDRLNKTTRDQSSMTSKRKRRFSEGCATATPKQPTTKRDPHTMHKMRGLEASEASELNILREALVARNSMNDHLSDELEKLKQLLVSKENEIARANESIAVLQETNEKAVHEVSKLSSSLTESQGALKNRNERVAELETELQEAVEELQNSTVASKNHEELFNETVKVIECKLQNLEAEKADLETHVQKLQKENQDTCARNVELESLLHDHTKENQEALSRIIKVEKEREDLATSVLELQLSLQKSQGETSIATEQIHQLKYQLQENNSEISSLKYQLSEQSYENETLKTENGTLKCELDTLQRENSALKSTNLELESKFELAENRTSALCIQVDTSTAQCNELTKKIFELEEDLAKHFVERARSEDAAVLVVEELRVTRASLQTQKGLLEVRQREVAELAQELSNVLDAVTRSNVERQELMLHSNDGKKRISLMNDMLAKIKQKQETCEMATKASLDKVSALELDLCLIEKLVDKGEKQFKTMLEEMKNANSMMESRLKRISEEKQELSVSLQQQVSLVEALEEKVKVEQEETKREVAMANELVDRERQEKECLQEDIDVLKTELDKKTVTLCDANTQIERLSKEFRATRDSNDELATSLLEVQQQASGLEVALGAEKKQRQQMASHVERLTSELQSALIAHDEANSAIEALQCKQNEMQALLANTTSKKVSLESELFKTSRTIKDLESKLSDISALLESSEALQQKTLSLAQALKKKNEELEAKLLSTTEEYTAAIASRDSLTKKIEVAEVEFKTVRESAEALHSTREDLEKKLEDALREKAMLETELESTVAEMETMSATIGEMEKASKISTETLEATKMAILTLETENAELKMKEETTALDLEERVKSNEALQQTMKELRSNLSSLSDDMHATREQNIRLNAKLAESQEELTRALTDRDELLLATTDLQQKQQVFHQHLIEASNAKAALENQVRAGATKIESLEKKVTHQQEDLGTKAQLLDQVSLEMIKIRDETQELKENYKELSLQHDSIVADNGELVNNYNQAAMKAQTMEKNIVTLEKEREQLVNDLHKLSKECHETKAARERAVNRLEEVEIEVKSLHEQVASCKKEKADIESKLSELSQERTDLASFREKIANDLDEAKSNVQRVQIEKDEIKRSLSALTEEYSHTLSANKNLESDLQEAINHTQQARDECRAMKNERDELANQLKLLSQEQDAIVVHKEYLEKKLKEVECQAQNVATELEKTTTESDDNARNVEVLKSELTSTRTSLSETKATLEEIRVAHGAALESLEDANTEKNDLIDQVNKAARKTEELNQTIADLSNKLTDAEEQIQSLESEKLEAQGCQEKASIQTQNLFERRVKDAESKIYLLEQDLAKEKATALSAMADLEKAANQLQIAAHCRKTSEAEFGELRNKQDEFEKLCHDLTCSKIALEAENGSALAEIQLLSSKVGELEASLESATKALAGKDITLRVLEEEKAALQEKLKATIEEKSQLVVTHSALASELRNKQKDFDNLQAITATSKDENADVLRGIREELVTAQQGRNEAVEALQLARTEVENASVEKEALALAIEKQETMIKCKTEELKSLAERLETVESEKAELEDLIGREVEDHKAAITSRDFLRETLNKAESKILSLEANLLQLETDNDTHAEELIQEARNAAIQADDLLQDKDRELQSVRLRLSQCEEQLKNLREDSEIADFDNVENSELLEKIETLTLENENNKEMLKKERADHEATVERFKTKMGEEQRLLIQEAEGRMETLRNEITQRNKKITELEKEAYASREANEKYRDHSKRNEKELAKRAQEAGVLEGKIEDLEKKLSDQETRSQGEISKLHASLNASKAELYANKQTISDLNERLRIAIAAEESSAQIASDARGEALAREGQLQVLVDENKRVEVRLQEMIKENQELKDRLQNLVANNENTAPQEPGGGKSIELRELKREVKQLKKTVQKKDERIEKLEALKITKEKIAQYKEIQKRAEENDAKLRHANETVKKLTAKLSAGGATGGDDSEEDYAQIQKLQFDNEALTKKLRKFAAHCQSLENEKDNIKAALSSAFSEKVIDRENMTPTIISVCDQYTSLQEECRSLQVSLQSQEKSFSRVKELEGVITSLRNQKEELKKKLSVRAIANQDIGDMKGKLSYLQEENLSLMKNVTKLQKQLEKSKEEVNKLRMQALESPPSRLLSSTDTNTTRVVDKPKQEKPSSQAKENSPVKLSDTSESSSKKRTAQAMAENTPRRSKGRFRMPGSMKKKTKTSKVSAPGLGESATSSHDSESAPECKQS